MLWKKKNKAVQQTKATAKWRKVHLIWQGGGLEFLIEQATRGMLSSWLLLT